ncbi:MAG TPA: prepilin peptidase [Terriglobales bacterium]|nr:prepilin peptidase [Terriglobales bacterium]
MPFDPLYAAPFFVYGLALGSFLNVCIYRLPRGLSVVRPGSACPACGTPIAWYDNLPVASWLLLKGRCRACRERISPRYLVVELLTGLLFVACYATFGWTLSTFKFCTFAFLVLGLIFTDAEYKLLPDALTLSGLAIGLGFSVLVPVQDLASRLLSGWVRLPVASDFSWRLLSLVDSGLGAAVGASFIYGAGAIYRRARGVEGMGFGDVKLMGMVGAFLGVKLTIFTLFAASLTGSIFGLAAVLAVWWKRTRRRVLRMHEPAAAARKRAWKSAKMVYRYYEMPFGVFLGSMALLAAFFGNALIRWYLGFYR